MFGLFCSPLDYLYARFKLYQKNEKYIPHFRRTALFTSGGGIPEGKEGEQYSHVRDKALPEGKEKRGKRGMVTKILPRAGGVSALFAILSEYAV